MRRHAHVLTLATASLICASTASAQPQIRLEPPHDSGQSVTGAFEGWFANPDGTYSILLGYFNRNFKQELDIPVGPANKIEPGGPDQGQPTHFLPRRQWGVFTVTVPKDFGKEKITWTLTANGVTTVIPASLDPLWELEPLKDATGNTPPYLGFEENGPFVNGPRGHSAALSASVGAPLALPLWVSDDARVVPGATRPRTPPVALTWSKFRGSGPVTFSDAAPPIETMQVTTPSENVFKGRATTTVTFTEPGVYILRVVANDWSGDGGRGFQCCWSNAQVKVSVKPR
jgi:hypothetical protein